MAGGSLLLVFTTVLIFCVTGANSEWCTTSHDGLWGTEYDIIDCPSGCCGYWPDQYCCTNIGGIVGGVIGCLIFLAVLAVIIVLIKKHKQKAQVVVVPGQPQPAVTSTVVYSH